MLLTVITLVILVVLLAALALRDAATEARHARKRFGYERPTVGMRVTVGPPPDGF